MRRMKVIALLLSIGICALDGFAQNVSTANLRGTVKNAAGTAVDSATVTARDDAHSLQRTTQTNADGAYVLPLLPPGTYTVSADANGYSKISVANVVLTVGEDAVIPLTLAALEAVVTVVVRTEQQQQLETARSSTTSTITRENIDNLPINGRNYVQFALTDSQVKTDSAPFTTVAPTSGLSFQGARARSNLINVDGGDAEDSIINGIRSTVSQDAVQEFQVLTNSFAPEYGRSAGGVVNIVTRAGSNDFHGTIFGYLRDRSLQGVNPFSTVPDPAYTRVQSGFAFGGPIRKDRMYYFLSYETTRREETGFSTIGSDGFGLVNIDASRFLGAGTTIQGTPDQQVFLGNAQTPVNAATQQYAAMVAAASSTALSGTPGVSTFASSGATLPLGYVPLSSMVGNYPVKEGTSLWGARLDYKLTDMQQLFLRANVSPSTVTGLTSQIQGQVAGQAGFSRTDQQQYRDVTILATHMMLIGMSKFNELRFQFSRRGLGLDPASTPEAQGVGIDILGASQAFFGQDPQAAVHRSEQRFQLSDGFSWTFHNHSIKFGEDASYIPLNVQATTEFGGDYVFSNLAVLPGMPAFSGIQAYGLGLPQSFTQGLGNPNTRFIDKTLGAYIQDSWKLRPNLIVNYGVRYDVEFTPTFAASTAMAAAAQQAMGTVRGLPVDAKDIAPRLGLAWDPWNDGKTVVRASAGIFYDRTPLEIAYQSAVFDGSQTPFVTMLGGPPCAPNSTPDGDPTLFNAPNVFQGIVGNCFGSIPGYLPQQQKFDSTNSTLIATLTNQGYLTQSNFFPLLSQPIALPTAANFVTPYSEQGDFQIEHQFSNGYSLRLAYDYNGGRHLYREQNINAINQYNLVANWERAVAGGAASSGSSPLEVSSCGSGPAGAFYPAALLNFFRPSGVNPSLTALFPSACVSAAAAAYPGWGVPVPFSDTNVTRSNGTSDYNGFTAELHHTSGKHLEYQLHYTYSHAIDDSTDFNLGPQNDLQPSGERANSLLDQRHLFIVSGIYHSGRVLNGGAWGKLLSDWTIAPLLSLGSGRPFNLLDGSGEQRPEIAFASTTDLCGNRATPSKYSPSGYLIPVCTNDGVYDGVVNVPVYGTLARNTGRMPMTFFNDLRVSRTIALGERMHLSGSVDMFNLVNKFNVEAVNTFFTQAGRPTAAYDPRQFQLGLKLGW
ncbi:MAG TPA: TonB-dependent receptor [Candidatus Sulfotelmatobacter sp.]|nr:TonB-dependent receptor [Candidatus Sulfotelmatobacter sp.]